MGEKGEKRKGETVFRFPLSAYPLGFFFRRGKDFLSEKIKPFSFRLSFRSGLSFPFRRRVSRRKKRSRKGVSEPSPSRTRSPLRYIGVRPGLPLRLFRRRFSERKGRERKEPLRISRNGSASYRRKRTRTLSPFSLNRLPSFSFLPGSSYSRLSSG